MKILTPMTTSDDHKNWIEIKYFLFPSEFKSNLDFKKGK